MPLKMTIKTHCEDCGEPTGKIRGDRIWLIPCNCKHVEGPVSPPRDFGLKDVLVMFTGGAPMDLIPDIAAKCLAFEEQRNCLADAVAYYEGSTVPQVQKKAAAMVKARAEDVGWFDFKAPITGGPIS